MPSAYITETGEISTNSHYFITTNSKVGITQNIEFSIGNIFITNIFSSLTYSRRISNSFTGALSILGNYSILGDYQGADQFNGWGVLPRVTFGDSSKNTTIGFVGFQLPFFQGFLYGGYFGSQKKISERFTIAGESIGLTLDGHNILLLTNVILNYTRNRNENWSFGVILLSENDPTINIINNSDILPFPYIGIQRKF